MVDSGWQNQQDGVIFSRSLKCPPIRLHTHRVYGFNTRKSKVSQVQKKLQFFMYMYYLDVQLSHDPSRNTSSPPWLHVIRVGIPWSWEWWSVDSFTGEWLRRGESSVGLCSGVSGTCQGRVSKRTGPADTVTCYNWKRVKQHRNRANYLIQNAGDDEPTLFCCRSNY